MAIITMIIGILFVVGGFSCMFTPLATFMAAGYFIGIMLFIFGIFRLITAIRNKLGAMEYITAILALVVGALAVINPGNSLMIDAMIIILAAIWFIVQGFSAIVLSIKTRGENKMWGFSLVVGILGVILGVYSLFHPMFGAITLGFLIGFFLIQTGLNLIAVSRMNGNGDK